MSKYIIKNCPAFSFAGGCLNGEVKVWDCQDCNYCAIKQIVSRLNNFAEDYGLDAGFYADELLSYLDIQEVE